MGTIGQTSTGSNQDFAYILDVSSLALTAVQSGSNILVSWS